MPILFLSYCGCFDDGPDPSRAAFYPVRYTPSSVLSDCGLTDADWDDIKACLVVAGEETGTTITAL